MYTHALFKYKMKTDRHMSVLDLGIERFERISTKLKVSKRFKGSNKGLESIVAIIRA